MLIVKQLQVQRGRDFRVGPLSADFAAGVTCLLGPNGSGKTTLISALATTLPLADGTVELGLSSAPSAEYRRSLGWLPQHCGLPHRMRVRAFLEYCAVYREVGGRAERRRLATRSLDTVRLGDRSNTRIGELSGGMRQRLLLAQAVLSDPELLLLDEPTVALDPAEREQFYRVTKELAQSSTVLFSTHMLEDVEAVADRVLVFTNGGIRFDGAPAQLKELGAGGDSVARLRTGYLRVSSAGSE